MNIYVGNIPYRTEKEELQQLFEKFGEVESVDIIVDRRSGRSRGYGFVSMPNENEASKAIEELDGCELDGRNLRVDFSRPKQADQSRGRRPSGQRTNHNQRRRPLNNQTIEAEKKPGGIFGFLKKIFG